MKKTLLLIIFIVSFTNVIAQTMETKMNEERLLMLEDKIALKELVDTFSNLADTKDIEAQLLLFTEDATVASYRDGVQSTLLEGHEAIGEAFTNFLNLFETVFHQNGQQTVKINGDEAAGIAYCTVVLIANNEGVRTMTTLGIRYNDTYVKTDSGWLIKNRISNFLWQDVKTVE